MQSVITNFGPVLGRILISVLFLSAGIGKVMAFAATAEDMTRAGLPVSEILLSLTIVIEIFGAIMLIVGWKARWAAAVMFLWMIPVTLVYHDFWTMPEEGGQAFVNQIMFLKNLAIMGAMLFVSAFGPGSYSLEKR
jgi:putative oxidoreductase